MPVCRRNPIFVPPADQRSLWNFSWAGLLEVFLRAYPGAEPRAGCGRRPVRGTARNFQKEMEHSKGTSKPPSLAVHVPLTRAGTTWWCGGLRKPRGGNGKDGGRLERIFGFSAIFRNRCESRTLGPALGGARGHPRMVTTPPGQRASDSEIRASQNPESKG